MALHSRAGLFRREIHAAEQRFPARIGMQILKGRIYLEGNKGLTFLHRFLQNPECLILVAERRVNSGNTYIEFAFTPLIICRASRCLPISA